MSVRPSGVSIFGCGFEARAFSPHSPRFAYEYDAAGNLARRVNGVLEQTFTTGGANELLSVSRNAVLTVAGSVSQAPGTLTVNGQPAEVYDDLTFAVPGGVSLADGVNTFTVVANDGSGPQTRSYTQTLPASVGLSYDANGNLTSDGQRSYEYDCANQLTRIAMAGQWKSEFAYDGLGRRRIRREYVWSSAIGNWQLTDEVRYVYAGRVVLQERSAANAPRVSYTRGLDLSGSRQGAGGIGGLLARTDANGSAFYHADGGGNVTALVDGQGALAARYLYDPYGNLLGEWGPLAGANRYRFSSKEWHAPSGLYDYGFRYYEPNLQRWLTRDPLGEAGGINLYGFVESDPVNAVDPFGLQWYEPLIDAPLPTPQETAAQGEMFAGMVPIVGELMDIQVLRDPESRWWERLLAGVSLAANALTDGLLPNVGGVLRSSKRVCKGVENAAESAGKVAQDLLSDAKTIGQAGRNSGVRVVGSVDELNQAFASLSQGGKVVNAPGYKGTMVEFADGTRVGLRSGSRTGGPTIDVFSGGQSVKIHVEPYP